MVEITDENNFDLDTGFTSDGARGYKIHTNVACTLLKITKHSLVTTTRAILSTTDDFGNIVATADFDGDDATFSYELSDDTDYYIGSDSSPGSATHRYLDPATYPQNRTNINYIEGIGAATLAYNILSITTEEIVAGFTRKIKISGTFQDKPIKTKVGGTFVDKPIKIKVGGTFQDA